MSKYSGFKVAALAASIALAMGSTSVMAAAPTATQLPGAGKIVSGTVAAGTIASGVQTINITGNAVINWGTGTDINKTQPGGFNIGSGASLTFAGTSAADAVLNIDSSGNPSQIFGALSGTGTSTNVFVANANGIIVGAGGSISSTGEVGLIANTLGTTTGFAGGNGDVSTISYNGTGGNVSVLTGADISGSTVFVSGGGTVNVDLSSLTGGNATLSAGLPQVGGSFATKNASAVLAVSGSQDASIVGFSSAGNASNSGTLNLTGATSVAGTFTNTGTLGLSGGFALAGGLVNSKTVNATGGVSFGSLTNSGAFTGGTNSVTTTDGGLTNSGQISGVTGLSVNGGDLTNNGQISGVTGVTVNEGNLANNGAITLGASGATVAVTGGDLVNVGSISSVVDGGGNALYSNFAVNVADGSVNNSGKLTGLSHIYVNSNSGDDDFTAGADYSFTNSGTITAGTNGTLRINANWYGRWNDADNDSTGSFTNTGVLDVGAAGNNLFINAYNDLSLGGSVVAGGKALAANKTLGSVELNAVNGVLTDSTPLFFSGQAGFYGEQVKLMANVTGVDDNGIYIEAGDQLADDYAVRIASGVTLSSDNYIEIEGNGSNINPNVILQGTLATDYFYFYGSDFVSGPNGSLEMANDPYAYFEFTGRVKNAPYLNDVNNFRYNYLPINVTDGSTLELDLNPVAYTTNGTSNGLSAVNILVNGGSVSLDSEIGAYVPAGGSAVTGVTNIPNTHLVLQSTGNISTNSDYYWPGYVYLGTIGADADGNALPGTLGLGQITLGGNFNNVLPGSVDNGGGIHFITQFPLGMNGYTVTTNANSWVNFGTDTLTNAYANGTSGNFNAALFFGGTKGAGNVVNYGNLDPSLFQTQAPVAAK